MSTEIKPFDPISTVQAIREKIQLEVLNIIPSEQWEKLIQSEIKSFMEDKVDNSGYNRNSNIVPAGFKQIVRSVLCDEAKKKVQETLNSPEWIGQFKVRSDGVQEIQAGNAIKDYINEHGVELIQLAMKDFVGVLFQSLITNINSKRY